MSKPVHILTVEDNPDDYEAAIRSFKKNHFINTVQWCSSGQEALDYLQKDIARRAELPELILLDLNMPGLDGWHLLQYIKTSISLRAIPVVILTTSADEKDVDRCYALGANTYIQKPVTFEGLTVAIRSMGEYWFNLAILSRNHKDEDGTATSSAV